jgi:hypothetical protein
MRPKFVTTVSEDNKIALDIVDSISVYIPDGVPEDRLVEAIAHYDFGSFINARLDAMNVEDVFDEDEIVERASELGVGAVFDEETVIDWINETFGDRGPYKVFNEDVLAKWALDNGFEKKIEKSNNPS